jgi:uncharacterized protein
MIMALVDVLQLNLLSPMVLAFLLGVIAVRVKSDLRIPEQVYSIISIYLLFAIGLKGGFDLAKSPLESFGGAALVAALLGAMIPLWSTFILRRFLVPDDAIAVGLHFGAVSAVTLSAAIAFLDEAGVLYEGFMPTLYVVMEMPAVAVSLILANRMAGERRGGLAGVVGSALRGKSFMLLGGGVLIGLLSGETGYELMRPFYVDLFPGMLTLFLLEMGTLVGERLDDLRKVGLPLLAYSLILPPLHGGLGVLLGTLAGLSVGGAMILGTLAASASYITAPAVVTSNLPKANAGLALTAALVIAFPLNLTIGLPLYYDLARMLGG